MIILSSIVEDFSPKIRSRFNILELPILLNLLRNILFKFILLFKK